MKVVKKVKSSLAQKIVCCVVAFVGVLLIVSAFKGENSKVSDYISAQQVDLNTEYSSSKYDKDNYAYVGDVHRYVGGDAYNYIIASSIKGGKIAGASTQKNVRFVGGLILLCFASIVFFNDKTIEYEEESI